MHNSSYSRPKFVLEAKDIHKSKGKSCGYYLRMVFFFSSLIQTLIIVSLVLFLVYGRPEKTVEEQRVEELENGFNKLSKDNTALRKDKANLTSLLKTKTAEKDAADKRLKKFEDDLAIAKANSTKLQQDLLSCKSQRPLDVILSINFSGLTKILQDRLEQQSRTLQNFRFEMESVVKEKNKQEMTAMKLKQEKDDLNSELQLYMKKCKEDFITPLQGIRTVTSAFLTKIDDLFPNAFTFHLTCTRQQEEASKICGNCTNLSRQVERKYQSYLDTIGEKVATLLAKSGKLEVDNSRLISDLEKCRQDRTQQMEQCTRLSNLEVIMHCFFIICTGEVRGECHVIQYPGSSEESTKHGGCFLVGCFVCLFVCFLGGGLGFFMGTETFSL
uniref:Plasmalemma vesicle associated protein b n=1 Tax=Electrophorus electricus TaxID=8005 RepID=A0A4W4FYY4_ELEEL